jgi:hypothetical protein
VSTLVSALFASVTPFLYNAMPAGTSDIAYRLAKPLLQWLFLELAALGCLALAARMGMVLWRGRSLAAALRRSCHQSCVTWQQSLQLLWQRIRVFHLRAAPAAPLGLWIVWLLTAAPDSLRMLSSRCLVCWAASRLLSTNPVLTYHGCSPGLRFANVARRIYHSRRRTRHAIRCRSSDSCGACGLASGTLQKIAVWGPDMPTTTVSVGSTCACRCILKQLSRCTHTHACVFGRQQCPADSPIPSLASECVVVHLGLRGGMFSPGGGAYSTMS